VTVQELKERMSAQEFMDWREFAASEPFLAERVDLAGALMSSVVANSNRPKNAKPYTISDFMIVQAALDKQAPDEDKLQELHLKNTILTLGGSVT
jgi:hypothetical protein